MSTDGMSVKVTVRQRSLFPRYIEPQEILLDGMGYGSYENEGFRKDVTHGGSLVAFHRDHIGRGIRVSCYNDEKTYEIALNLPTSSEELEDFFQMTARLAKKAICEVFLNDEPFVPKKFKEIKQNYLVYNLKLLHEMMGKILDESPHTMSIGCVFHRLVAGEKEADRMWAGINTDNYRDWMHESQKDRAFFSQARVIRGANGSEHVAMFTLPASRTVIFPNHMELPIRFYDLSTGLPKYDISRWEVEFTDRKKEKVFGTMRFEEFRRRLPKEKTSYYDAADILIEPFSEDELLLLLEEAGELHA